MEWDRRLLATARGQFEVFIKGEGTPLCVTHHYSEFNETGDYFADTFTKTNRVYLVNLRETGNSEKAIYPHQLSLLETVLDLEAVRQKLGHTQWGFAGHSTGGMLGLVYGIYFSEKLLFTIIVGAAAREYMTFSSSCIYHPEHPQFAEMQALLEKLKRADMPLAEKRELKMQRTKLSLVEPDKRDAYFSQGINKELSAIRLNFFSRELHVFDVTRKLSLITTPTLILCGRHDVQCPPEYSMEMEALIANSTLTIFEKSNHYPFLEEADQFTNTYQSFVRKLENT